jgi:hypothetical protein
MLSLERGSRIYVSKDTYLIEKQSAKDSSERRRWGAFSKDIPNNSENLVAKAGLRHC